MSMNTKLTDKGLENLEGFAKDDDLGLATPSMALLGGAGSDVKNEFPSIEKLKAYTKELKTSYPAICSNKFV
jgi:hypothetical protein